jgi:hypothetical protein
MMAGDPQWNNATKGRAVEVRSGEGFRMPACGELSARTEGRRPKPFTKPAIEARLAKALIMAS